MKNNRFVKFLINFLVRVGFVAAILGVLYVFQHYQVSQYLPRNWIVLIHVIGTVVFLGNIIVSAAWMLSAGRSEQALVLNFASNGINRCDMYFIQPGVFILVVTGLILAIDFGSIYNVGWMTVSVALFSLSGIVWALFLRRYQNKMANMSKEYVGVNDVTSKNDLPDEFYGLLKRWYIWGTVAMGLVIGSLAFMSLKPELW